MYISVQKLEEAGYSSAMHGLSLNKNQPIEKMHHVATILSNKDGGHNKFLESIYVWLLVRAPRYWWQDADTYRMSTKQSQSTNHTLTKRHLEESDFETYADSTLNLKELNKLIDDNRFLVLKSMLPEGFLQSRVWCLSYKTLRNIIKQRTHHKLPHWNEFIRMVLNAVEHPEFLN